MCVSPLSAQTLTTEEQESFIASVWARDIAQVEAMLIENPIYADSETSGISALLFAVFARDDNSRPFLPPETNPLVTLIASHKSSLDIFEAAVLAKKEKVAELFSRNPGLIHGRAKSGWTPLHYAAFSGDTSLIVFLLEKGAAVDPRAGLRASRITPLQAALLPHPQRYSAAKKLLENGADVLVRSLIGFTPLHEAAQRGSVDLIRLFVDAGAELEAKTDDCKSPLDLANDRNQVIAAQLLEELEQRSN